MNSILALQTAHVSTRRFLAEPVDERRLADCLRAAQRAASSHNVQGYSVLRVRDPSTRATLAKLCGDQPQVADAPLFLVISADSRRHRLLCARAGKPYLANLETFLVDAIDAALFAQNLILGLESEGLSICCIGGLRNDLPAVERLLAVPDGVYPLFGLCAGRAAQRPPPRERLPLDAIYYDGAWPDDASLLAAIDRGREADAASFAARGKAGHTWSGMIERLFTRTERDGLAAYYRSKGARLD